MESEQVHLTWEVMISCIKIAESVNSKLQNPINISFDFLNRDTLRKKDLILLVAIVGASNALFKEKCKLYKIEDKLLFTLLKKKRTLAKIDLIKQFLSLILKEDEFNSKLN
jgi:hypothetical protein